MWIARTSELTGKSKYYQTELTSLMRHLTSACYSGGFKSGEEGSTILLLSLSWCLMLLSFHLLLLHFSSILKLFMSVYFPLNPSAAKSPHIRTYFCVFMLLTSCGFWFTSFWSSQQTGQWSHSCAAPNQALDHRQR